MKRLSLLLTILFLFTALLASGVAQEPALPNMDYEGFYARLTSKGVSFPMTLEQALGGLDITYVPEITVTVDSENSQIIVDTGDTGVYPYDISLGYHHSDHQDCCRVFSPADQIGVYTAEYLDTFHILSFQWNNAQYEYNITSESIVWNHYTYYFDGQQVSIIYRDASEQYSEAPYRVEYSLYDWDNGEDFTLTYDYQTGKLYSWAYGYSPDDEVYQITFLTESQTIGEVQLIGHMEEDGSRYSTYYPYPSWLTAEKIAEAEAAWVDRPLAPIYE